MARWTEEWPQLRPPVRRACRPPVGSAGADALYAIETDRMTMLTKLVKERRT